MISTCSSRPRYDSLERVLASVGRGFATVTDLVPREPEPDVGVRDLDDHRVGPRGLPRGAECEGDPIPVGEPVREAGVRELCDARDDRRADALETRVGMDVRRRRLRR